MNIIETHELRKQFKSRASKGKEPLVDAVKGVTLTVAKGQIFGFLGPNGAGKTTTLRMLSTLLPPTSGEARVVGYELRKDAGKIRQHIGYVSQAGGTDSHSSAVENLHLQARLYGMDKPTAKRRTDELLMALQLDSFATRLAKTYSGGQKRRLDLALGMVNKPALLFLDEPTTGLDPQSRAHLWEEVRKLRDQGTTVFLTTHYLDEADALADRLAIMDDGKIVAEGTPNALKQQIAGDVVTLGIMPQSDDQERVFKLLYGQSFVREIHPAADGFQLYVERGEENLPTILRLIDGAGLKVSKVALARPTLDDVFLRQTGHSLRESEAN